PAVPRPAAPAAGGTAGAPPTAPRSGRWRPATPARSRPGRSRTRHTPAGRSPGPGPRAPARPRPIAARPGTPRPHAAAWRPGTRDGHPPRHFTSTYDAQRLPLIAPRRKWHAPDRCRAVLQLRSLRPIWRSGTITRRRTVGTLTPSVPRPG